MTKHRFTFRERTRYRFDNVLSRGTSGMVLLLFSLTVAFLLVAAMLLTLLGIRTNDDQTLSFREAFWQAMLRAMDPGTMGGDSPWALRIASLIITLIGIFVVSALIGILATGLDSRLAALQRGRGRIAVAGHTLILGWSPKVFTIIAELAVAKESDNGGTVVVLADRPKSEMDDVLAARLQGSALRGLTVVTRSGSPSEPTDVAIVNPDLASSIIVLSDDQSANDAGVIKTVLALLGVANVDPSTPIVAEIASSARAAALHSVTDSQVVVVEPGEIIARAAAQSSRETGLNLVLQELFDFGGSEIYFTGAGPAAGQQFGDVLNGFEASTVIGVCSADGTATLNPPMETVIGPDDQLVVIAEDDSTIKWTGARQATVNVPAVPQGSSGDRQPEVLVMFGWNDYGASIVQHLDEYVSPGSQLTVVLNPDLAPAASITLPEGLSHVSIEVQEIPDSEGPVGAVLQEIDCDHVLILCYRGQELTAEEAESRALTTFLEARTTLERLGRDANVTAELLDERDVMLIPSASAGEFMVSEKLASLIMAQLSENIALAPVIEDLLDADGSEVYCKPAERYSTPGEPTCFADLVETAKTRGEVAIGWRIAAQLHDAGSGFGVTVNPPKSTTVTFQPGDQIVVLAEDDT